MQTTQCPDLFVTYREGSIMNTRSKHLLFVDDSSSFSQWSKFSTADSDSVKNFFSCTE